MTRALSDADRRDVHARLTLSIALTVTSVVLSVLALTLFLTISAPQSVRLAISIVAFLLAVGACLLSLDALRFAQGRRDHLWKQRAR